MKGLRNTPRVIRWAYFSTSVVTLAKQGFNCFTGTMYKNIIFFGIFPSISANALPQTAAAAVFMDLFYCIVMDVL